MKSAIKAPVPDQSWWWTLGWFWPVRVKHDRGWWTWRLTRLTFANGRGWRWGMWFLGRVVNRD